MVLKERDLILIRYSLVVIWIASGTVSLINDAAGRALLFALPASWANPIILAGSALDLALGLALMIRSWIRLVASVQIAVVLVYTILATLLVPELWLDPLMPLAKNLPVLVLTMILARSAR